MIRTTALQIMEDKFPGTNFKASNAMDGSGDFLDVGKYLADVRLMLCTR